MPRKAREKNPYAIYHITCRSISEILLFIDNADKEYYLKLLKRYLNRYHCSLYAYCLMNNHIHLHLDTKGFNISTFMLSLSTAYVRYYNKKYNRHGHLFQGRFVSKILYNDAYNIAVSAYIHNNPKDIKGYAGCEESYEYSSYGVYLGSMPDRFEIVDKSFIKGLFNMTEQTDFVEYYRAFVKFSKNDSKSVSVTNILSQKIEFEYNSGRTVLIRENNAANIISYISEKLEIIQHTGLSLKAKRKLLDYRALVAYALRVLCNLTYKNICKYMLNITITSCARLCSRGHALVSKGNCHLQIFNDLIENAI
jgi:REP element-mobilizing transposase RayT